MGSRTSWWASKARQLRQHLGARVTAPERAALAAWLRPPELALFDAMHPADRRHGLKVVAVLRRSGVTDRNVLVAGLLHDCAKGDTGALPRIAWSLGEAYGGWVHDLARRVPGWAGAMDRLRDHADASAVRLADAGLPGYAVELVRNQAAPTDARYGALFQRADEAS